MVSFYSPFEREQAAIQGKKARKTKNGDPWMMTLMQTQERAGPSSPSWRADLGRGGEQPAAPAAAAALAA